MKPARKVPGRVAAATLAFALGLALAGCGAGSPGVAATVNGTTIPESAVDDVARDYQTLIQAQPQAGARPLTRADIVGQLVARPVLLDTVRNTGDVIEPDAIRYAFADTLPDASDAMVSFLQVPTILNNVDQSTAERFTENFRQADVDLNPRYGTFDPQRGMVEAQPNWIARDDAAGTQPQPDGSAR